MNKIIKFLIPLLCLQQWITTNGEIVQANEYSNANFKAQLDGSFKKYFNDNIYKIREYSRDRRFFNRRQDVASSDNNGAGIVQDLSCGGTFISNLKSCSSKENDKFSCVSSLTIEQFNAYISCTTSDVPNYGNLINSIVLNSLSKNITKSSFDTVNDVTMDVYSKIKFVANKNHIPYTTDKFISEMMPLFEDSSPEELDSINNNKNIAERKLISTDYYNCLKLVDKEIYPFEVASVCLCSYGYENEIKGYSKDVKLNALYKYYDFSEDKFNSVCTDILSKSSVFVNENKYISNLSNDELLVLLEGYNIPNYGIVFNTMLRNVLSTSTNSMKYVAYELYKLINDIGESSYDENDTSREFGRCLVQAKNKIVGNSGLSYCLCNAGYDKISPLKEVYDEYKVDKGKLDDLCSDAKYDRRGLEKCGLGSSVRKCIDKVDSSVKANYTQCLDIGVKNSYLRQTKCLCDFYRAKWKKNDDFLKCYGYTELSFILGCRQFYPNQMFSDNPARGIEDFYSENYDEECGDSGTGGGNFVHDPCICKIRAERQEVSLEMGDICSRVGTDPSVCSDGWLSFKFSKNLIILTIIISLLLYI